jgi:radical SAM protein with 4Fe4S-binding SPASM domain
MQIDVSCSISINNIVGAAWYAARKFYYMEEKMRFKKIYIEITNVCNLSCEFCIPHHRENRFMNLNEFEEILNKIDSYTKYIYLHVKGEPLLHPQIKEFIKLAYDKGFKINLTTNGTLLKEHLDITKYIRQINISLHATKDIDIIHTASKIKDSIICFRIWVKENNNQLLDFLEKEFNTKISEAENIKLSDNVFLSQKEKFEWPTLTNEINNSTGYCYGLKDQIAILVDGTVVPCCLDNDGDIPLGNIFKQTLLDILNTKRSESMIEGFKNRKAIEELCIKCSYKNRF